MPRMSRREMLKWGAVGAGALSLEAFGGGVSTASKGKKVTIVVSEEGSEFLPEVIDHWNNSHPNIRIQTTISTANTGKLATQLASGTGPDTIRLYGSGEVATYVTRGVAMDLTSRMHSDKRQYPRSDMSIVDTLYQFNGSVQGKGPWYGLPKDWSPDYTIWYNQEAFAKAGIPVPSSTEPTPWPQLFSMAKELTGGKQFGFGYWKGNTQLDSAILLYLMAQRGVKAWSNDHKKAKFNQTEVADIVSTWANDVVAANLGPNSVNGSTVQPLSAFPTGQIAMLMGGYWYSGDLRENYAAQKASTGLAPAPITPGGKRISPTATATGAIINAHTKHPDEAWQVFSYLYGKDYAQLVRAQSGWGFPTFNSRFSALPTANDWDKNVLQVAKGELKYFTILDFNPYVGIDALDTAVATYINPVYFGKSSAKSALAQLDASLDHTIQATLRSLGHQ